MTVRAANAAPSARELVAVFAILLATASAVAWTRATILGTGHGAGVSFLTSVVAGTLAFWAFCAAGCRGWARALTALLLLALCGSALAAVAARRLDPVGVMPRFPVELPQVPHGLVRFANWLVDRPPTWVRREPALAIHADGSFAIDGTPQADFTTLAAANPQRLEAGTHIVVEGVLATGGVYVGLQQAGRWIDFNTIDRPGPFRKWLVVARDDDYELVVAYGVVAPTRTRVDVSSLTLWR